MTVENEWSQHQKLIDFTRRPFRKAMVANLPYFMVQWDYKGEKGYGHVIEGDTGKQLNKAENEAYEEGMESAHAGGDTSFKHTFASEIIAGLLRLPISSWRKPARIGPSQNKQRINDFLKDGWEAHDWTEALR